MKSFLQSNIFCILIALCCFTEKTNAQTTYVSQDFSSSTTVSDYVNSTSPNSGQFNSIGNTSGTVAINNGQLRFVRSSTGSANISRTTDFSPTPTIVLVQFDLSVPSNSAAQTTAAIFYVGQNFSTGTAVPGGTDYHSRLGLNFTGNSNEFSLRNINGTTNSTVFTGQQTIRWYINNSGATYTYTAPDGTIETLANDAADVFVGTTKAFNDIASPNPNTSITDFKFIFNAGQATVDFDNISISEPGDAALPVEFIGFNISVLKDLSVQLQWQTASEINNAGFEIYRSEKTENSFKKIASYLTELTLAGLGTSATGKQYSYIDRAENLTQGRKYIYKVVDVDFNGGLTEHDEKNIAVELDGTDIRTDYIVASPNPATDAVNIGFTVGENQPVTIVIYNSLGQVITVIAENEVTSAGTHAISYPTAVLPAGIYTISVITPDRSLVRTISIIH